MPILPNMGLATPTLGGDSGVWDDEINAAFALVDAHDHTSGKGIAVPVAGMNINANLPMAGFGLDNLGKISFTPITAPVSGSKNLFVNTADNELYWRSSGGANVKLTTGSTINMTLVGGIVGDYASVGAEVAFDDANKRYTFKDQSSPTKKWARIASGPVRLYEYNTTVSNYVELASPVALGASYSIVWPGAIPGTAGSVMTFTTANPTVGAFTTPDAFLATVTAGAVSTFVRTTSGIPGFTAAVPIIQLVHSSTGTPTTSTSPWTYGGAYYTCTAATAGVDLPINIPAGAVLTAWGVHMVKSSGSGTLIANATGIDNTGSTSGIIGSNVQSNNAVSPGAIVLGQTGLAFTIPAGNSYYISVSKTTGVTGDLLLWAHFIYYMP